MSEVPTFREGLGLIGRGIRDEPVMFGLAVAGSAVFGASVAGSGWVLGRVTDAVLVPAFDAGTATTAQVWQAAGLMALVGLVTAAGVVVRRGFANLVVFRLQARYRRRVSRQYLSLPLAWHRRHPTGQLLSNAGADVEAAFQVFAPLPFGLGVFVMLLVATVAMLAADWALALVALTVLPLLAVANALYQRVMSPRVSRAQQLRAEVADIAHESFDGALVVKTLGREAGETARFAARAHRLRDANVAMGRTRSLFEPFIEALPALGTIAVLALGTWRVQQGTTDTGDVVQVAYQLTLLAFPMRAVGWVLAELPRSVVGWRRVAAVLDASGRMTYGDGRLDGSGDHRALRLRAEGVDYDVEDPDGSVQRLLHDVHLDVAPGTTVAVVGSTGAGKSTLAGVLVRLVDPVAGRVLLDAADVRELAPGVVAEAVAYVPQSTFVFDETVRRNVAFGLPDGAVSDDGVWAALRAARADGFVAALPGGLDTRIGERGASLSGGQRQRLAIARALVRRPAVLVLDDATSAVDPAVEQEILDGMRSFGDVSVVVVAYRRSTISLADEVVHVEHGRVVDRGPHEELLARDEGYRRLVEAYDRDAAERAALAAASGEPGATGEPGASGEPAASGPGGRSGQGAGPAGGRP